MFEFDYSLRKLRIDIAEMKSFIPARRLLPSSSGDRGWHAFLKDGSGRFSFLGTSEEILRV